MLTKADFQKVISDTVDQYPAIAPLYQAGDPRITQHLDAMAAMLAMFSAQIETAMAEPFEKTRDATVLADAALRGIVRKSSSARVRLLVTNKSASSFTVDTGRNVFDSSGIVYRIETSATIGAGLTATVEATQIKTVEVVHTVANSEPFYSVEIEPSLDDAFLCGISVSDSFGEYEYRERYVNTLPDERVYHIEVDDRQRAYVRFGAQGVVGTQPLNGSTLTINTSYAVGDVSPSYGSPFSFEYILSPIEASIEITMDSLLIAGQNPPDISMLRDLSRYPSVYDTNAVFLGEFDFMVRRNFQTLKFLSVWNEYAEEMARGPNYSNINTLFVACMSATGTEAVLTEPDYNTPVAPAVIAELDLTAEQKAIRAKILAADDSYKVTFYTPVISKIAMTINAVVSTAYIAADVQQKIIEAILLEYGEGTYTARRGKSRPLYQRVYELLRKNVAALSGSKSDLTVSIIDPPAITVRPEMWRYVDLSSLTVTVTTANVNAPSWGG